MNTNLSQSDIRDLLQEYESDKRKLEFQLQRTSFLIEQLKKNLEEIANVTYPVTIEEERYYSNGNGSNAATEQAAPATAKKSAPAKEEVAEVEEPEEKVSIVDRINQESSGYRLSEWDSEIIEGLERANHALINSELYQLFVDKNAREGHNLDETDLKGKLNRSLHKLANKRAVIVKLPYEGRGFMYALTDWLNSSGGLRVAHKRKK